MTDSEMIEMMFDEWTNEEIVRAIRELNPVRRRKIFRAIARETCRRIDGPGGVCDQMRKKGAGNEEWSREVKRASRVADLFDKEFSDDVPTHNPDDE
jgi:hypothetical protein